MSSSQLDEVIAWLEEGRYLGKSDPSETEWLEVFSKLKEYLRLNPLDGKGHYVLGYAYFSKGENKRYPEIETYLRRSLELDPNRPFSTFYLGMYYFNCEHYEKSFSTLSGIDLSFFASIDQRYRIAEVLQVKLCDRLYLRPSEVDVSEVARVADELYDLAKLEAARMDMEISIVAVTPYALTRCIDSLFQQSEMEEKAGHMFDVVFDLLLKLGQEKDVAQVIERVRVRLEGLA